MRNRWHSHHRRSIFAITHILKNKIHIYPLPFHQKIDSEFVITEIISNESLRIATKGVSLDSLMQQNAKKSFKVIPKLDQSQMYESVWKELSENQCIGIFPEGGSHDRTDLLPLKAGVCIMALGAM